MAHELTLAIETPIEDLIPKMIAFNNTELLSAVEEMLAAYDGVVYDENSISIAKQDMAILNAEFDKSVNTHAVRRRRAI